MRPRLKPNGAGSFRTAASTAWRSHLNPKYCADSPIRSRCKVRCCHPPLSTRTVSISSKSRCAAGGTRTTAGAPDTGSASTKAPFSRHSSYSSPAFESATMPAPMPSEASPVSRSTTSVRMATENTASPPGRTRPMAPV